MCRGELAARENRFDDALTFYSKAAIPQASFSQVNKKSVTSYTSADCFVKLFDIVYFFSGSHL